MIHIVMCKGLNGNEAVYLMSIYGPDGNIELMFDRNELGWLNMQVAKDSLTDSINETKVSDMTVDPR